MRQHQKPHYVSECDQIKFRMSELIVLAEALRSQRNEIILNGTKGKQIDAMALNAAITGITQYDNEIAALEAQSRKLGCGEVDDAQSLDNQTVISTSSVRRKDARALAIDERGTCAVG